MESRQDAASGDRSRSGVDSTDHWTQWINDSAAWERNSDNVRRLAAVLEALEEKHVGRGAKLLDVGCGSGWATLAMSKLAGGMAVTGTDLAVEPMLELQRREPSVEWIGGDFGELTFPRAPYDGVVSMETIAHVPDQRAFAEKIAQLTRPGGCIVLTTQNPSVWGRASWVDPNPGHKRDWPTRARLVEAFEPYYRLDPVRTCAAGSIADRGLWPRILTNRLSHAAGGKLFGPSRWMRMREAVGCGCSLLLTGTRK
jgi:2-polyprenyl-3-methyl-5-hydroxy-6-metoxy-1,4-benzoquinol methylase